MNKTYDYIHAEGVIREKATMIDPGDNWPRGDDAVWEHDKVIDMKARKREYDQHIASLKTYPVSPSLRELWGGDREVVEGKDFEIEDQFWTGIAWWPTKHLVNRKAKEGTKLRTIAVPLPAEAPYNAAEGLLDEQSVTVSEDELWDEVESWIVTFTGSTKMEAVRLCQKLKCRYTLLTKQHQ